MRLQTLALDILDRAESALRSADAKAGPPPEIRQHVNGISRVRLAELLLRIVRNNTDTRVVARIQKEFLIQRRLLYAYPFSDRVRGELVVFVINVARVVRPETWPQIDLEAFVWACYLLAGSSRDALQFMIQLPVAGGEELRSLDEHLPAITPKSRKAHEALALVLQDIKEAVAAARSLEAEVLSVQGREAQRKVLLRGRGDPGGARFEYELQYEDYPQRPAAAQLLLAGTRHPTSALIGLSRVQEATRASGDSPPGPAAAANADEPAIKRTHPPTRRPKRRHRASRYKRPTSQP